MGTSVLCHPVIIHAVATPPKTAKVTLQIKGCPTSKKANRKTKVTLNAEIAVLFSENPLFIEKIIVKQSQVKTSLKPCLLPSYTILIVALNPG